jgi:uncharacterized Zn-binding protein involved in type VI secretion
MAAVATYPTICSGHGAFPPRTSLVSKNTTVFVEGKPIHVVGDDFNVHTDGETAHTGFIASGSANVFVNGQSIARIGDGVAGAGDPCGSIISAGSPTVYCGG